MHPRLFVTLLLVALVVLAVGAGCGGGDSSAEVDTSAIATSETTDDSSGTMEDDSATTTEDAMEDDGDETEDLSGLGLTEECEELAELSSSLSQELGASDSNDLETTVEILDGYAARAPEEIRDDFGVLADVYRAYLEALGDDFSPDDAADPAAAARIAKALGSIDTQALGDASMNITGWVQSNCTP